jgi:hypothetical protein
MEFSVGDVVERTYGLGRRVQIQIDEISGCNIYGNIVYKDESSPANNRTRWQFLNSTGYDTSDNVRYKTRIVLTREHPPIKSEFLKGFQL